MDPIRPIGHDDAVTAVDRIPPAHVRRETDDEATDRRRREAQERERKRQAHLRAGRELPPDTLVSAEDAPDGHPHVDMRA